MTVAIILSGLIALLVMEFYKLGREQGRSEGWDEAVSVFEEEVRRCLSE